MSKHFIPYWVAVAININIVIGSAFFFGAQSIAVDSGPLGLFVWLGCGILLMPLVAVFARFSTDYPEAGGIYIYSRNVLGSFAGFVSCWGYFLGTIAGNAAVLYAFCHYVQQLPWLGNQLALIGFVGLPLEIFFVALFAILNLLNIQILEVIQLIFTVLKIIPMLCIVLAVFFIEKLPSFSFSAPQVSGAFGALPMVLFAYTGLEACCAVMDKIKQKEGGRAVSVIWASFGIIVMIYVGLQGLLYLLFGTTNVNPFLQVLSLITTNPTVLMVGNAIIYLALMSSFLGGYYGGFYFSSWNLYALGKNNVLPGSSWLQKTSKDQVPYVCVFVQFCLIVTLLFSARHSYYLATMCDIGIIIAYLITAFSFIKKYENKLLGFCALLSCSILAVFSFSSLYKSGLHTVLPFVGLLGLGIVGYWLQHFRRKST